MHATITVRSPVVPTPRVAQVRGLFDLPETKTSEQTWDVHLPLEERPWRIGLVTGPSGCGKSTLARHFWPAQLARSFPWPEDRAIVDAFPETMSIRDTTALLSSVGFASPPAWLRPFRVLSTGQQFRVTLARHLAEAIVDPGCRPVVLDEFTSVVDRTVARIGSAALARTVRDRNLQLVTVTCHEDVLDWLQPDWVYHPAERCFQWRAVQPRPGIELRLQRTTRAAWPLFAPHHYLSGELAPSAVCFLATWEGRPVGFSAWLPFVGSGPPARREHRTVVLPDFQGIGIGSRLSDTMASLWRGLGFRALSTTTHPALIHSRCRSGRWRMHRPPSLARGHERVAGLRHATTRLTAGFEYIGPPLPRGQAAALLAR
jgi:GNAT superfamily N-acetyltransferase